MSSFQKQVLNRLQVSAETTEKAQSLLRLAAIRTGPGTGYLLTSPSALPFLCAYLASQSLNNTEITEKTALTSACISRALFTKDLSTVRAALQSHEDATRSRDVTYEALIRTYRVTPASEALDWMEEVETCFPQIELSRQRYGIAAIKCAIFYWTSDAMEIHEVQESSLYENYSIQKTAFKALVRTIEKNCEAIADKIKADMTGRRASRPSASQHRAPTSPSKSPSKSALKGKSLELTPAKAMVQKRSVVFSHSQPHDFDDDAPFPETPTKKRKLGSPSKSATAESSPRKRSVPNTPSSTASFHLAMSGASGGRANEESQPSVLPTASIASPISGPSTPRRTRSRPSMSLEEPATMDIDEVGGGGERRIYRRFRPIFVEQQQWCCRDPKTQDIWAQAEEHKLQMMSLYGHPFDKYRTPATI
ncbi:hypothetical protein BV22DRAFT_1088762 [Leucogyrophana mollusca]|uniref:Uncharacterized protein n=1 Tax=Leucogyrophana mollusca TaxID=85980 RepID=A0ACB8BJN6_9AGAM|nr:hypothetical protein BV22DRAFT_1088762 [Leucogyrophana mollusca]